MKVSQLLKLAENTWHTRGDLDVYLPAGPLKKAYVIGEVLCLDYEDDD